MKAILTTAIAALSLIGFGAQAAVNEQVIAVTSQPPEAVRDFHFFGHLDSWRPIDRDTLIVWTTPFRPYLIELQRPALGLKFAHAIGVTSTNGTVYAKLDAVKVRGLRYPIKSIYRLSKEQAKNWGRSPSG